MAYFGTPVNFYVNLLFVELLANNLSFSHQCNVKVKRNGGDLHSQHFMLTCRMRGDIASCCPYACMMVSGTKAVGVSNLILEISITLSF